MPKNPNDGQISILRCYDPNNGEEEFEISYDKTQKVGWIKFKGLAELCILDHDGEGESWDGTSELTEWYYLQELVAQELGSLRIEIDYAMRRAFASLLQTIKRRGRKLEKEQRRFMKSLEKGAKKKT